jgi:hypothetical protein
MKLRLIGVMLIAAISLTAATTASAFTAFQNTKTGEITLNGGKQELKLGNGKTIACNSVKGTGQATALEQSSLVLLITYEGCEAFGSKVTVTTGEVLHDANGSITLPDTEKFIITSAVGKCSVLIESSSQTTVKLFGTIKYTNLSNGKIEQNAEVSGLSAEINGGTLCGTAGTLTTGSYIGNAITGIVGGTAKVV